MLKPSTKYEGCLETYSDVQSFKRFILHQHFLCDHRIYPSKIGEYKKEILDPENGASNLAKKSEKSQNYSFAQ